MAVTEPTSPVADDIVTRLRAVLDAIDARHMPKTAYGETFCREDAFDWPCPTHLLIHPVTSSSQFKPHDRPMTVDEAIWVLGDVHK